MVGGDEYGKYIVIWGMVVLIGQLSALGLPIMYVRMGADYLNSKSANSLPNSNYFSMVNLMILLPVFFLIILIFYDKIDLFVHDYLLIFISAGLLFIFRLVNGYNRGSGEVFYSQVIDVSIRGLILLAVSFILYLLYLPELNGYWQSVSIFLSLCASILLAILVAKKNGFTFSFNQYSLSRNWRDKTASSIMIFSGNDIKKVEEQLMYVFVGLNISYIDVAVLVIATRINDIVMFLVNSANYALIPKIRLLYKKKDTDFNKTLIFFFLTTIGSLLLFMPIYFNLDDIILWYYGKEYELVTLYVLVLLIAIFLGSLIGPAQNIATMVNFEKVVFKINIVVVPLTIVAMHLSSLYLGVVHVLCFLLIGRIIGQLLVAVYLYKKEKVNIFPISNIFYLYK